MLYSSIFLREILLRQRVINILAIEYKSMLFTVTFNKEKQKNVQNIAIKPCLQTLFGYLASQLADYNGFVVVVIKL